MSVKQGPPSARRDCGSNEPGQDDRMARWRRFGNDKTLEIPSIDGKSCLMGIRQQYQNWPRAHLIFKMTCRVVREANQCLRWTGTVCWVRGNSSQFNSKRRTMAK